MIFIRNTVLQQATSIVLALYFGAFLGQALCVLHSSDMQTRMGARMGARMDGPAAHVSSSMATDGSVATHGLLAAVAHASSSRAVHSPSQHGEHTGTRGADHSGECAVVTCASAIAATLDYGLQPMHEVSNPYVAYIVGTTAPDSEMIPPPPRLG